jgi:Fuc2NAc and GlcNAc transferase
MLVTKCFLVVAGSVVSWALLKFILPTLQLHILDFPNSRSSHYHPTPSGGGLSFVLVACIASVVEILHGSVSSSTLSPIAFAPLVSIPLALVGIYDDRFNLHPICRFCVQFATAFVIITLSPIVPSAFGLLPILLMSIPGTAVINFVNFMDGMDGLVAGCMSVFITVGALQLQSPFSLWVILGALIGFLFFNWSPARVFMGDVGSTFLGVLLLAIVLQSTTYEQALSLFLVVTPLLADSFFCMTRRLLLGQKIFQAHRLHLYQRLHQAGWSHSLVSTLYILASALLGLCLLFGGLLLESTVALLVLFFGLWLDQRIAIPFSVTPFASD